jgi:starch synthase
VDCTPESLEAGTATGFTFLPATAAAFLATVQRALQVYRKEPETWKKLMSTGMKQDWSWDRSAAEYERLYLQLRNR